MNFKVLKLAAATAVLALGCANAALADVPSWCGPKKATIALLDGYGGNSWRQVTTASGKQTASLCPSITSYEYADGNGDTTNKPIMTQMLFFFPVSKRLEYSRLATYFAGMCDLTFFVSTASTSLPSVVARAVTSTTMGTDRP